LEREKENMAKISYVVVNQAGGSRTIAVTPFVPKDWRLVAVSLVEKRNGEVVIRIRKVTDVRQNSR